MSAGTAVTLRARTLLAAPPTLEVSRAAISANMRRIGAHSDAALMAVVKADGYGHGAVTVAEAAIEGGASWLGTTDADGAARLREAGLELPILSWLHAGGIDAEQARRLRLDLAIGSVAELDALLAQDCHGQRVHLFLDIGMSRGAVPAADWPRLFTRVRRAQAAGGIVVVGLMGHLPMADRGEAEANAPALLRMRRAVQTARVFGVTAPIRHFAATAAALNDAASHGELLRIGAGLVGIDPSGRTELHQAGTLRAPIVHTMPVPAGTAVGYDGRGVTSAATTLGVVPLGYADGIPRELDAEAWVLVGGRRCPLIGRVSMDQIVVDLGPSHAAEDAVATIFGPGTDAPSIGDWARWAGTIPHTIVTGIGPRVNRTTV